MNERTWTAADMLPLAADWLLARHPGAKLIEEFVCGRAANARVDLAAITGDEIVGVEIKACSDDGRSLKHQGYAFSAVCRQTYLFTGPGALSRTLHHRPEQWGDLRIMETAQGPLCAALSEAQVSPFESAPALLSLLWGGELNTLARANGIQVSHRRLATIDRLCEVKSLGMIRAAVVDILLRRRWRTAFKRIGSQVLPAEADI